jgi:hypothetical protein
MNVARASSRNQTVPSLDSREKAQEAQTKSKRPFAFLVPFVAIQFGVLEIFARREETKRLLHG